MSQSDYHGFHSRDGWHFKRMDDGSVRMRLVSIPGIVLREITLPENEWASVLASVSARGETGETWQAARDFHAGGASRMLK